VIGVLRNVLGTILRECRIALLKQAFRAIPAELQVTVIRRWLDADRPDDLEYWERTP